MLCDTCGGQIDEDASFCMHCGASLYADASAKDVAPAGSARLGNPQTPNGQAETVGRILSLEKGIIKAKDDLELLNNQTFQDPPPEPPRRKEVQRVYPTIEPPVKANYPLMWGPAVCWIILALIVTFANVTYITSLLVLLGVLTVFVWPLIYYFAIFDKKKTAMIEAIRNTPQYQAQCRALDRQFDAQQAEFDRTYETEKEEYEAITLPAYHKAKQDWEDANKAWIADVEERLQADRNELEGLYRSSGLIPSRYRSIEALQHIYDIVSSSNYDVTYAIQDYKDHLQRLREEAMIYEKQEENRIREEQNTIAKISEARQFVQDHNRNKQLKRMADSADRK